MSTGLQIRVASVNSARVVISTLDVFRARHIAARLLLNRVRLMHTNARGIDLWGQALVAEVFCAIVSVITQLCRRRDSTTCAARDSAMLTSRRRLVTGVDRAGAPIIAVGIERTARTPFDRCEDAARLGIARIGSAGVQIIAVPRKEHALPSQRIIGRLITERDLTAISPCEKVVFHKATVIMVIALKPATDIVLYALTVDRFTERHLVGSTRGANSRPAGADTVRTTHRRPAELIG